jgi:hypothetical protein
MGCCSSRRCASLSLCRFERIMGSPFAWSDLAGMSLLPCARAMSQFPHFATGRALGHWALGRGPKEVRRAHPRLAPAAGSWRPGTPGRAATGLQVFCLSQALP